HDCVELLDKPLAPLLGGYIRQPKLTPEIVGKARIEFRGKYERTLFGEFCWTLNHLIASKPIETQLMMNNSTFT
ncbi:MAG: hypothetical protein AAF420_05140, partial [Pseudomonadota bacterium]